jgi:hypothetical protein
LVIAKSKFGVPLTTVTFIVVLLPAQMVVGPTALNVALVGLGLTVTVALLPGTPVQVVASLTAVIVYVFVDAGDTLTV